MEAMVPWLKIWTVSHSSRSEPTKLIPLLVSDSINDHDWGAVSLLKRTKAILELSVLKEYASSKAQALVCKQVKTATDRFACIQPCPFFM